MRLELILAQCIRLLFELSGLIFNKPLPRCRTPQMAHATKINSATYETQVKVREHTTGQAYLLGAEI
jgi:hypothetical protein